MNSANLEHVNITVSDPDKTAGMLCGLFDWKIRWQGDAINGGRSVHVGSEDTYLAIYSPVKPLSPAGDSYSMRGGMNHIGVVVDDLGDLEARVRKAGFAPYSFGDYEPGRRFYFRDSEGVEIEVVSYSS